MATPRSIEETFIGQTDEDIGQLQRRFEEIEVTIDNRDRVFEDLEQAFSHLSVDLNESD